MEIKLNKKLKRFLNIILNLILLILAAFLIYFIYLQLNSIKLNEYKNYEFIIIDGVRFFSKSFVFLELIKNTIKSINYEKNYNYLENVLMSAMILCILNIVFKSNLSIIKYAYIKSSVFYFMVSVALFILLRKRNNE